jgi:hypothetical protein
MLRCIRCGQSVTLPGLIGETVLHAPTAMLYHWNMIRSHDEENHRESMLMSLLFTFYDNYLQSSKSFEEGLTWNEDLTICQKPTKYRHVMFCEAVEVDMTNSKETSFKKTISGTLSLITVLFEDLFEAITLHRDFSGEKVDPEPSILLLNKTNTSDGYAFNNYFITDEVNALKKESLMLFEGFCIFGYREFYKKLLCILMEVNKIINGNNKDIPDKLLDIFLLSSSEIRNHMNRHVRAPDLKKYARRYLYLTF